MRIERCLFVCPNYIQENGNVFLQKLYQFSVQYKMQVNKPISLFIKDDKPHTFTNAITEFYNESQQIPQMIICLIPKKSQSYHEIKKLCCAKLGIPSQCLLVKSLKNPKRILSICGKIVQQINCKVGGDLWQVQVCTFFQFF